jgi:hypothetical protein
MAGKAKEIAIGKRAKISQAQQYMLIAVLGAAIVLGAAVALNVHFIKKISYQAGVIGKQDESIVEYSDTIKNIGICEAPNGDVYTLDELKQCDPNSVEVSDVPGTLRSDIVENMAANKALNSVPKEDTSVCINPSTQKNYTYIELNKLYNDATNSSDRIAATKLIKICSALRIIPDALPAYKNEEALLSSLNKIFNESGWQPESISPTGEEVESEEGPNALSINLSLESDMYTAMKLINNMERSIRDFDIKNAVFEWNGNHLAFQAQANAYYVNKSKISESTNKQSVEGD